MATPDCQFFYGFATKPVSSEGCITEDAIGISKNGGVERIKMDLRAGRYRTITGGWQCQ
jgi:hypothetical protein